MLRLYRRLEFFWGVIFRSLTPLNGGRSGKFFKRFFKNLLPLLHMVINGYGLFYILTLLCMALIKNTVVREGLKKNQLWKIPYRVLPPPRLWKIFYFFF